MTDWASANQRYLMAALAVVRASLERHAGKDVDEYVEAELAAALAEMPSPPALQELGDALGLSAFERDVLVLCAGVELHSDIGPLLATLQGDPRSTHPTFSLALAALPHAHWSAVTPNAPLRYWRLLEMTAYDGITSAPLRIDERILHYLAGQPYVDQRLEEFVAPPGPIDALPSHVALGQRVAAAWSAAASGPAADWPVVQLCGSDAGAARAVASVACSIAGLQLHVLSADAQQPGAAEFATLNRLWDREAFLGPAALLVEGDALEQGNATRQTRLFERLAGAVFVSSREPLRLHRASLRFDVRPPAPLDLRDVWLGVLGPRGTELEPAVNRLVAQFALGTDSLRGARAEVVGGLPEATTPMQVEDLLWRTCRIQARAQLADLAQRIEPVATWDDLVLPAPQQQVLRDVAEQVRHRGTVYERWGFGGRSARGLGITALFSGPSGTGKTMAAEVLANELRLDLYCIDLASVVSKYIGETEKNLRRVFDAAEESGAILLFDEADALFGKRTDVKDSHDRYANIEVSYLLQRMEAYRGLAILTSNLKNGLDTAFMRRLRFVVQFPFPDASQRVEIWRRVFPDATPVNGLDHGKLARLNVAGGNIRTIALNAAFIAAGSEQPVDMKHVLRAASAEYVKLERALTEAEVGGWI
jgi:hypothetical protein